MTIFTFKMSFHLSAVDIRIEDGHVLVARLRRADGELQDASIDLDNCLGNDNGTSTFYEMNQMQKAR